MAPTQTVLPLCNIIQWPSLPVEAGVIDGGAIIFYLQYKLQCLCEQEFFTQKQEDYPLNKGFVPITQKTTSTVWKVKKNWLRFRLSGNQKYLPLR